MNILKVMRTKVCASRSIGSVSFACALVSGFTLSAVALPDYEPFSDSTGSGGTSYTVGSPLAGQVNASGQAWYELGPYVGTPDPNQPTVASGDLVVPGLASTRGGRGASFGGDGNDARLNLSVPVGGITSGSAYFSFALKMTDISALTSGGLYWAGFNNVQSQNAGTGRAGTVVTRVLARSATGGYNIGLQQGTGGSFNTAWDSRVFTTDDTLFLVGSYTFNTGSTTDDVARLWVNPDASTFAAEATPGGELTSTGGNDIARVASFILYNRSASEPYGVIDDLRFGRAWADVTPVPEPSTGSLCVLGCCALLGRAFRRAQV
jgi:hypothetical protein